MGYFAVVKELDQPFEILACHVNLWSLPGVLRRSFFLDVGLRIKAGDKQLKALNFALPFGTEDVVYREERGIKDLSQEVCIPNNAKLVFGSEVIIHETTIKTDEFESNVIAVNEVGSKRLPERSGKSHSFWNIVLAEPIQPSQIAYIRVRFQIFDLGRTWVWKSSNQGAIVDFRVADIRESVSIQNWKDIASRVVPIQTLNMFVIAPAWLQQHSVSPELRYIRLLEGQVWEGYLKRKTAILQTEKLVIYYWRHKASPVTPENPKEIKCVDTNNPFRIFLDLNKSNGNAFLPSTILSFILTMLAVVIANQIPTALPGIGKLVKSGLEFVKPYISVLGVVIIIKWLHEKYGVMRATYPWVIRIARMAEDSLYKIK